MKVENMRMASRNGDKPQVFVLTGTQTEKGVALPWLTHETKRKQVTKGKGKWGKQGERLWLEACYLLVQNGLIKCWSYLYICTSLFIWKPYICFILLNLPYIYELCLTLYLFWFVFIYLCIFMYLGFFFLSLSAAEVLKRFPAAHH